MALSTYAELQTSVATWIKRSDLTSLIPDFITLAEARINRDLRVLNMVTQATSSITTEFAAVPTDFRLARSIRLVASPYTRLDYLTPEAMADYAETLPTGDLAAFSVVGDQFWFLPAPSEAVSVKLTYYQKVPALSASATSNWLLASHPDAYLWGTLLEACVYLEDEEQVQKYDALFSAAMAEIRANSTSDAMPAKFGPAPSSAPV